MMNRFLWIVAVLVGAQSGSATAQTRVDQLLTDYSRIMTMSCEIRKDSATPDGEGRMLSRVWFEAPNRLLVENFTPFKRKILCDGQNLYYYADDGNTAIQQPFNEIRDDMRLQTQSVPASPMEHLFRLKGLPETNLTATTQWPVRTGYTASNLYAVLCFDSTNRLAIVEFYTSAEMTNCYAKTVYSVFEQPVSGVWLPLRHETEITVQGQMKARETRRFSNLKVNQSVPADTFKHEKVFPGVTFAAPPRN